MKFRGESHPIRRFTDSQHPDVDVVPEKESGGPKYDPLTPAEDAEPTAEQFRESEESGKAEEKRQSEMEEFVAASGRKNGRKSAPSRDALAKLSPIQKFAAWSDFRRHRR